ncbi:MAG: NAD(P)H-dependent oxidoreductase subunit E, partial [Eggerthellaceae bacterium]|nr:NAD(P)H-dependent oxidoreductase subunit E [Eggerthellaceae bacterium]
MMYANMEELRRDIGMFAEQLEGKFSGADGKKYLVVCGGTGCLAAGTPGLKEAAQALIDERGLADTVEIRQVGCFGLCSEGPFVRVFPGDILYRLVKPEDIEEIVDSLAKGKMVERLVYVDPQTGEKHPQMEDIPFYRKQKRIALHGCGVIDPTKIEEALGYGAYLGLMNALSMEPQEVVDVVLRS